MSDGARRGKLLAEPGVVVRSGAHDALSASIVGRARFPLRAVTGAGSAWNAARSSRDSAIFVSPEDFRSCCRRVCRDCPDVGLVTIEKIMGGPEIRELEKQYGA